MGNVQLTFHSTLLCSKGVGDVLDLAATEQINDQQTDGHHRQDDDVQPPSIVEDDLLGYDNSADRFSLLDIQVINP